MDNLTNMKRTVHYYAGGMLSPEKSSFTALCGKVFDTFNDTQLVYAENTVRVTCKQCREKLDAVKVKNESAVSLGRLGGLARAKRLSKERLTEISIKANKKRWGDVKEQRKTT